MNFAPIAERIKCPCGREVVIGYLDGTPSVMHVRPECADFIQKDVLEYVTWLRKRMQS